MLHDSESDRDTSNERLRIAPVAPLYESVPPQLYGGTERVVSWLTEKLVALGHDVTLFASGDSRTRGHLVPVRPMALWRDPNARETLPQHVRMLELVFRDLSRFDVIHFHCYYIHFPLVRRLPCANVSTLHGQIRLHDVEALFKEYNELPLVSISDAQQRPLPSANWQATEYHGLPRLLTTKVVPMRADTLILLLFVCVFFVCIFLLSVPGQKCMKALKRLTAKRERRNDNG